MTAIDAAGGEGMSAPADLTGLDGCASVVDACAANWGGVDILVNVAGAAKGVDILELPADLVGDALALKSFGYLRMAQLVIPHMQASKWGRIVNIGGGDAIYFVSSDELVLKALHFYALHGLGEDREEIFLDPRTSGKGWPGQASAILWNRNLYMEVRTWV